MKVIQHGRTYGECICDNCGCMIGYCSKDIEWYEVGFDCDDYKIVNYISCPECLHKITVSRE